MSIISTFMARHLDRKLHPARFKNECTIASSLYSSSISYGIKAAPCSENNFNVNIGKRSFGGIDEEWVVRYISSLMDGQIIIRSFHDSITLHGWLGYVLIDRIPAIFPSFQSCITIIYVQYKDKEFVILFPNKHQRFYIIRTTRRLIQIKPSCAEMTEWFCIISLKYI